MRTAGGEMLGAPTAALVGGIYRVTAPLILRCPVTVRGAEFHREGRDAGPIMDLVGDSLAVADCYFRDARNHGARFLSTDRFTLG